MLGKAASNGLMIPTALLFYPVKVDEKLLL